jgi:hypothetical protein
METLTKFDRYNRKIQSAFEGKFYKFSTAKSCVSCSAQIGLIEQLIVSRQNTIRWLPFAGNLAVGRNRQF